MYADKENDFRKMEGKKHIRFQIKTDTCEEDQIYTKVNLA